MSDKSLINVITYPKFKSYKIDLLVRSLEDLKGGERSCVRISLKILIKKINN